MRSRTPLIALLGAAALALTSCAASAPPGGGDSTDGVLADGKTFTAVFATDPGTLDPFTTTMGAARQIDRYLYSRLVEVQNDGEVLAGLAAEWEADTEGAVFTLRDGLTCEDGTPLTATDVARNIAYIGDPANGSPLAGLQVQPGTTAVGDDAAGTVTVTSGRPDAFLLQNIGSISIVCGTVVDDADARAVGEGATGMFTLSEIVPNSQYTLTRRDDFTWGPGDWDPEQPGLPETVIYRVIPNETTAANLVVSGEVNAALVLGPDRQRLRDAGLFVSELPLAAGQLFFNQAEGHAGADQAVREALVQALDLGQLRQVLTGGEGTEAKSLVTIAPNPCQADVVGGLLPEFDEKSAAASLDDAGWEVGSDGIREKDGVAMEITLVTPTTLGNGGSAAAELMQASWKKLGVAATIKTLDGPSVSETLFATGDWDVSAVPLGVSLPSMLVPFYSGPTPPEGTNFASVTDEAYATAVTAASSKPGTEGCADWEDAEKALFTSVSVVPYANNVLTTFGHKATFTEGDGIDPASIRMYE
ncbi:ABC transporter substrate-binding protein [Microbacterium sp. MYb62]|uniref:ABC transporter substrate-binding protein n=1 Tax=Microbacterium sp. MYb62 TaxID=1848690 RepID=UPI000CFB276B|nr:ABC transporter substrate-binding protein [Microbacterium sp. MYb62]PRB16561.1 peptide ABC transporter substrate-binding protein [Microbacterium sp. MYb62]